MIVDVIWASVPAAATLVTSALLVGRQSTAAAIGRALAESGPWTSERAGDDAVRLRHGRLLLAVAGGRTRQLSYRGSELFIDPGDLVLLVALPIRRRTHRVVWARDLATQRRWVAPSVLWAVFVAALACVVPVVLSGCW